MIHSLNQHKDVVPPAPKMCPDNITGTCVFSAGSPQGSGKPEHRNAKLLHAEPERHKMSDITMGPPGSEWQYTPRTRTYNLTRSAAQQAHILRTTRGAEDISVAIDPTKSALVVIDMQNYFLHPSCDDFPSGVTAADPAAEVVRSCRQSNIKVSNAMYRNPFNRHCRDGNQIRRLD